MLFPVVTVALGAALAGEIASVQVVAGALLVMVGTYVGALSPTGRVPRPVASPTRASST